MKLLFHVLFEWKRIHTIEKSVCVCVLCVCVCVCVCVCLKGLYICSDGNNRISENLNVLNYY